MHSAYNEVIKERQTATDAEPEIYDDDDYIWCGAVRRVQSNLITAIFAERRSTVDVLYN